MNRRALLGLLGTSALAGLALPLAAAGGKRSHPSAYGPESSPASAFTAPASAQELGNYRFSPASGPFGDRDLDHSAGRISFGPHVVLRAFNGQPDIHLDRRDSGDELRYQEYLVGGA